MSVIDIVSRIEYIANFKLINDELVYEKGIADITISVVDVEEDFWDIWDEKQFISVSGYDGKKNGFGFAYHPKELEEMIQMVEEIYQRYFKPKPKQLTLF